MTDFDYEILEEVATYGEKGATMSELQTKFRGYNLMYNLLLLSDDKAQNVDGVKVSFLNANVLYVKREYEDKYRMVYTPRYFITDRGKALLANWQRNRRRERKRHVLESIGYAFLGAIFGTVLGQIVNRLLTLP